jgi:hypothetical protein
MTTDKPYWKIVTLDPTEYRSTVLALFAILEQINLADTESAESWQLPTDSRGDDLYGVILCALQTLGIDTEQSWTHLGIIYPENPTLETLEHIENARRKREKT